MPSVSSIKRADVVAATVPFGDETVTVQFDRAKVTLNWAGRLEQARMASDSDQIAACFAEVIHTWDLVNDDGTPYPPTGPNIATLPSEAVNKIVNSIQEASAPGEAEGNASSVPSSTPPLVSVPPPQTPQNGQPTSPSPAPSASPSLT
jgi:hypothetical protein